MKQSFLNAFSQKKVVIILVTDIYVVTSIHLK